MQLITIEKAVKKILQSAGLPDYYSVHSLRHTRGFHLYQANMNLKLVQERLRHANIQTASIYVGVKEGEEQETINGLYD
jgi:site-specific recombinase XerD